ncbi:T9SS type A sorting domain-containing protein [Flavobacterium sp. SUN052]|uniref:T9SS type A sorting domain-containing protein n=1 Tax=Flavobacterium sp. SUN052 TaxID=3002441 RepID=UPI00237EAD00|nr:T9SS type A sorting domain-containing protein [Flavobacterium sp. SUN052]MEC4005925.1 T9SS type A sorting domain-containing protein [Flavobacterium sp. SUN052]
MCKITKTTSQLSKLKLNTSLFFFLLFFVSVSQVSAQSNGIYESYAILSVNGGANSYYDLAASTTNPDLQGANLGSFNASNTLVVKGGQNKTFKCSGGDITGGNLYYRVWLTNAGPSGTFTGIGMGFVSNDSGGCGGNQTWQGVSGTTNIISSLTAAGNYTLEVYSDAPGFPSTAFASNSGANYKATFNFCGPASGALPVGNYSIPGCFSTIASAVTYLNANGVSGAGTVQFDVAAGYTETAPSTGILLNGLATGSATTQIIFKKNGSGTNPTITAPLWAAGGTTNSVIKIIGGDYITFDGFTIQENPANVIVATGATNTMTEIGIGIYLASATNGAQNNTIKNCTITLNSNFPNSIGIFASSSSSSTNTVLAATAISGTNSNNKIYNNTITNVAYGVYVICEPITFSGLYESGWDIGGASAATGNTINFGNASLSTNAYTRFNAAISGGIIFRYGAGMNVKYNSITSNTLNYTQTTLSGFAVSSNFTPLGIAFNTAISNNTISLTSNGSAAFIALDFGHGNAASTLTANSNTISIFCGFTGGIGGNFFGIKANYASTAASYSNNIITINQSGSGGFSGLVYFINADGPTNTFVAQGNNLQSVGGHLRTSAQVYGISHNGAVANSLTIGGSPATANTIIFSRSGIGTGVSPVYGFYSAALSGTTTNYTIDYNTVTISGVAGTSQSFGITNIDGSATTNKTFNNNTINLSGTNTGVSNGMFLSKGIITASNNSITVATAAVSMAGIDFTINGTVTSAEASNNSITLSSSAVSPSIRGINTSLTAVINEMVFKNNVINSITASATTGNPIIHGIRASVGTNNVISGNTIKNFTTGSGSGNATLSGITIFGGNNPTVFNNNINALESSCSGSLSTVSGISIGLATTTITLYNNLISELKAPSLSANTGIVGIACYADNSTYKVYHNTIKLGNATPISGGANFGALGVGLSGNAASTILDLRNNIINMNVTPSGNGFAACVATNSGVANAAPLGFATTSNNNIYTINSGANNYLFVQGADVTSPLVNGFAVSGLTSNTANNINNDTNFNANCALYKIFLGGGAESQTHSEDNLVAGIPTGVYAPNGLSFAENTAQSITAPAITTDFFGAARTPTNDIGAVQFSGTTNVFVSPSYPASVTIASVPSGTICAGTSVTFTATPVNGGTVPMYQWQINGVGVSGQTAATFTSTTLANNDVVTVVMTSNLPCVINSPATSNGITMSVNPNTTYYQDLDADGFGNPAVTQTSCFGIPTGYVTNNLDCNDNQLQYLDADGDGFGSTTLVACGVTNATDCNDANPAVNTTYTFYTDADGDGYGSTSATPQVLCAVNATTPPSAGLSSNNTDCDDANAAIHTTFTFYTDADGDGYGSVSATPQVLCAVNATTPPSAGLSSNNTDCDDTRAAVHPGAVDVCYDALDNDCNGIIDNVGLPGGCIPKVGNLQSPSCGATVALLTTNVSAINIPGAQAFRFKITNVLTNSVQIYDSPSLAFQFINIPGVTYATQYKVEVAVKFAGVWQGFYGSPCFVYTPSPTSVITTQCGTTLTAFTQIVNVSYVAYVTLYRFEITNQSTNQTQYVYSNQNKFTLSQLAASNQTYATNYFVRVALRNLDGTYLPEGAGCIIKSPAYPTTQVRTLQCNNYNVLNTTEFIYADANTSATSYRFRLFNGSYDAFYDTTSNKFSLSNFSGLTSGTTYSVQVALTLPNNPIGPYGKICFIKTPLILKMAAGQTALESNDSFEVIAYPNPFAANFKLNVTTNDDQRLVVKVYDMLGKLIENQEVTTETIQSLELGLNYPAGVYNIVISQGDVTKTQRVIKR